MTAIGYVLKMILNFVISVICWLLVVGLLIGVIHISYTPAWIAYPIGLTLALIGFITAVNLK